MVCPDAPNGLNPGPVSASPSCGACTCIVACPDRRTGDHFAGTCACSARGTRMGGDALSDVLRAVRLTGAVFVTVDVSPPWSAPVPSADTLAPIIMPAAQHLISYHLITQG